MPPLPVAKSKEVIRALKRADFYIDHQTGSHAQLLHPSHPSLRVTVPIGNKDIKRGTLKNILRQANMTVEQLIELL